MLKLHPLWERNTKKLANHRFLSLIQGVSQDPEELNHHPSGAPELFLTYAVVLSRSSPLRAPRTEQYTTGQKTVAYKSGVCIDNTQYGTFLLPEAHW